MDLKKAHELVETIYGCNVDHIHADQLHRIIDRLFGDSNQWIKIEDCLPPEKEWVLLFGRGNYVTIGELSDNGKYYDDGEGFELRPTYWKPLPKGPEEET